MTAHTMSEASIKASAFRAPPRGPFTPTFLLLLTVLSGAVSLPAQSSLTFALDQIFSPPSGGVPPSSATPWLTANFQNNGSGPDGAGSVRLTMTASNLGAGQFIMEWDFNLNPAFNPSNLVFALVGSAPAVVSEFVQTTDNKKADGDGRYDIFFGFSTSGANRFTAGEVFTYDISGFSTLTAADFNYYSTPAGGHGPFVTAAHIGGIGAGGDSVWVTDDSPADNLVPIPEPETYASVFGAMVLGIVALRRRMGLKK